MVFHDLPYEFYLIICIISFHFFFGLMNLKPLFHEKDGVQSPNFKDTMERDETQENTLLCYTIETMGLQLKIPLSLESYLDLKGEHLFVPI